MTAQQTPRLEQFTETIAQLSEALAASERRHAAFARTMRWTALALSVIVGGAIYAVSQQMAAYADQIDDYWSGMGRMMGQQPPSIESLLPSLATTDEIPGALVKVLQSAGLIASSEIESYRKCVEARANNPDQKDNLCHAQTSIEDLSQLFPPAPKPPENPTPTQQEAYQAALANWMMQGTLMAGGQMVVDTATLIHRIRRDSDRFRGVIAQLGGVKETLASIQTELQRLNGALIAVPAMANEMNVMNRQMSVMSQSIGSTMGRMGSWLP